MSAVGRLWRRAPAWRLCLVAAIVFTALAAMFRPTLPRPTLPHWVPVDRLLGSAAPPAADSGQDAATRYVPQPDPAPVEYDTIEQPPLGQGRAGIIPFASRQVPLPSGTWQELILARSGGTVAVQVTLLGRIEAQHLTGLMLAAAPDPISRAARPVAGMEPCFDPDVIAHQIIPAAPGQGPLARECWTLAVFDMSATASHPKLDQVMREGIGRLGQMAVAVPERMLALRYLRSDETGWFTALLLLPDRRGEPAGATLRLQAWAKRIVPLFHKGFDGTLTAAEAAPAMAHEPE